MASVAAPLTQAGQLMASPGCVRETNYHEIGDTIQDPLYFSQHWPRITHLLPALLEPLTTELRSPPSSFLTTDVAPHCAGPNDGPSTCWGRAALSRRRAPVLADLVQRHRQAPSPAELPLKWA